MKIILTLLALAFLQTSPVQASSAEDECARGLPNVTKQLWQLVKHSGIDSFDLQMRLHEKYPPDKAELYTAIMYIAEDWDIWDYSTYEKFCIHLFCYSGEGE